MPFFTEPTAITKLILDYLSLSDMIKFVDSKPSSKQLNPEYQSIKKKLRFCLQKALQFFRFREIRIIEEADDEIHIILAKTFEEYVREIKTLLFSEELPLQHKREIITFIKTLLSEDQLEKIQLCESILFPAEDDFDDRRELLAETVMELEFYPHTVEMTTAMDAFIEKINLILIHKDLPADLNQSAIYLNQLGITRLPSSLFKILQHYRHLKTLNLYYNHLNSIQGIGALKNLHTLGLGSNQLSHIEDLELLSKLQKLTLSDNPIETVTVPSRLVLIKTGNQPLLELPDPPPSYVPLRTKFNHPPRLRYIPKNEESASKKVKATADDMVRAKKPKKMLRSSLLP